MSSTKKYLVLVAGGSGTRMGSALPKQFLPLAGRPVLYYSIRAFLDVFPDIHIVLVLPTDLLSYAQIVLREFPERLDMAIVAGGRERFHSVQNGLTEVSNESIVFVHDGARPLVSTEIIARCYEHALEWGSAVPAVPINDSIRMIHDDCRHTPLDRSRLRIVQTPQTFRSEIILPAFQQPYSPDFTDEATVCEAAGAKIHLVVGAHGNMKITLPIDLIIAEALINAGYGV